MSKMTPGPWTAVFDFDDGILRLRRCAVLAGEDVIAFVYSPDDPEVGGEDDDAIEDANAQAIAALPDLIEALQLMVKEIESWHRIGEYERASVSIDEAKEALKKAGVE